MDSETRTEQLRAQLSERYGLTCVPRWGTPRHDGRKTYGGKVAKIAQALGTPLMPWQRYVADVALEVDPDTGLLAYRDVVLVVPRQSGKTTLLLATMVWRALAWPRQRILYAAQNRLSARSKWEEEHVATLEATRAFATKFSVRKTNGDEAIRWRNGSRHGITSNTETAGHGETLDHGVVDEAFAHEDGRMEQAFSPAMITRDQPQQWVVSTAGTEARSHFLNAKRTRGREIVESGQASTLAFFDWTVPEEFDRTDPDTWWACMPALGHTVTEAAVASELEKMEAAEFDRAYLNVTRTIAAAEDPNVPTAEWPELADPRSRSADEVAFAFDVAPDRRSAAIAVYGPRRDGRGHVEIVEHRDGTDWVVDRLVELRQRWNPVAVGVDPAGPAGSLLVDLEKQGIARPADHSRPGRGELAIPSARDAAGAAGAFADAVRQGTLCHLDQTPLNTALDGARTRPLGDAWAWARKYSSADISPLVAATVARWAYLTRVDVIDQDVEEVSPWVAVL